MNTECLFGIGVMQIAYTIRREYVSRRRHAIV